MRGSCKYSRPQYYIVFALNVKLVLFRSFCMCMYMMCMHFGDITRLLSLVNSGLPITSVLRGCLVVQAARRHIPRARSSNCWHYCVLNYRVLFASHCSFSCNQIVQCGLLTSLCRNLIFYAFWATVCKIVCPVLSDRCPVCLSVCLWCWYCGQMVGWIKMPLCTEVGLGPGDIVLDGDSGKR